MENGNHEAVVISGGEGGGKNSDHYLRDRRFRPQTRIKPQRAREGHFVGAWLWLCLTPL